MIIERRGNILESYHSDPSFADAEAPEQEVDHDETVLLYDSFNLRTHHEVAEITANVKQIQSKRKIDLDVEGILVLNNIKFLCATDGTELERRVVNVRWLW